jgi:hypothetical protein
MNSEMVVAIVRTTGGTFRLLNRVLTQMERVAKINGLARLDKAVVECLSSQTKYGDANLNQTYTL